MPTTNRQNDPSRTLERHRGTRTLRGSGGSTPSRRESTERPELAALWAMGPRERIVAMRNGRLTQTQLFAWVQRYPEQCPLLDGEWEFIARHTPEVAEPKLT